ncbi:outer membrane protein assembly factor BamA [Thermodesulfobacteriota bacterium]
MERFSNRHGTKVIEKAYNKRGLKEISIYKILFIILLCLLIPALVQSQERVKLAILPFRIHSLEPLDHLRRGLQEVFTVRMAEKGYHVFNPDVVNKHPMAFLPAFETGDIISLGKDLDADWVIFGSLTQIGKKISLDLKIVDIDTVRPPFSIFMVEDDIDRLADAAERAATSIDNQISGVVQIYKIQVKGNKRIESDAVLAVIESKKGEKLDQDQLDKDLRSIFKMGYFKDVNIESEDDPNGKIITFKVNEKPSITQITFDGNKKVKEKALSEEIGIKKYSILNQSEVKESINRLREHYRQKGYYNIKISEKIEELPNNEVSLIYLIDEGKKIYLERIEFIGNKIFDDDDLKDIMETSEHGFFSWLTKSGVVDKKKLEFDIQRIISFYHNRGYIRAKAGEPKITYEEGKGLKITIEISEGHQYKANKVNIEGDLIKPENDLLAHVKINKEKSFSREVVRKDIQMLRKIYTDEGFAYANVAPFIIEDDKNNLVDITYKITKKKRVRFERINISGNVVTRDNVIRRELKVVEGEFFNGTNLDKSALNLYRLGYFEDLEIKPKKGSQDDLMILDIDVKEKPTGILMVGVGYSSFENALASLTVAQNNLFGKGQKLEARAMLGGRSREFDVKFTEPWLFDKPLSASTRLYNWKTEFDSYTKDSFGGALGLGFPLGFDEYTTGSVKYAYDNADITDIDPSAALVIKDMAGKNVTSSVTLGIRRDSKNRPWNTSEGSLNSMTLEYAGGIFGGDSYYTKYEVKSAWYFPLKWETVLVIQGRAGYVTQRSGGKLPIYEKFMLGGINSVRGYKYSSISPLDPATGDKIGGERMWVYNLEYKFPLFKEQGVVGLVFYDAGNSFTEKEGFKFEARRSVGAGIRWYAPVVGLVRVEYGWKLDKRKGDTGGEMEFTIGQMF